MTKTTYHECHGEGGHGDFLTGWTVCPKCQGMGQVKPQEPSYRTLVFGKPCHPFQVVVTHFDQENETHFATLEGHAFTLGWAKTLARRAFVRLYEKKDVDATIMVLDGDGHPVHDKPQTYVLTPRNDHSF